MTTYINNMNYKNYTKFTQENNLTLDDDIILVQDIPASDMVKMERLEILSKKIFTTADEKAEMSQLQADLIDYMPNSYILNKLNGMVYGMQVYLKEGVVIFINQQKQELIDIVNNHKYMGIYVPLTTYAQGNMVMYDGYGFISKINGNIGHVPDKEAIEDNYWIRFTIKGDKGDPSLNISIKKGTDGISADFDPLQTYNVGDACVYNHRLYYCLADGTIGIMVTDTTKWACGDKIWIGTDEPLDHFVIWWDTNSGQNVLKRYSDNNEWIGQTVRASDVTLIDNGNYFTIKTTESALAQLGLKQSYFTEDVNHKLYYKGSKVGATNANEISLSAISGMTSSNVQSGFSELFTFANNGKTSVASVVGNLTSSNTFAQITSEIQTDKNTLATNLTNKGITASGNDTLRNLVGLVGTMSNVKHAIGTKDASYVTHVRYKKTSDGGITLYDYEDIYITNPFPTDANILIGRFTATVNYTTSNPSSTTISKEKKGFSNVFGIISDGYGEYSNFENNKVLIYTDTNTPGSFLITGITSAVISWEAYYI